MQNKQNRQNTFTQDLANQRGQVALFIALIFQVLFLFFAMVINVGLLVHHKINLQNSVDLAAYYGAMKQAENMNAIAHTNYQIRQSFKLLSWRYRILGSAGEKSGNKPCQAFDIETKQFVGPTDEFVSNVGHCKDFQEAPAFCIAYFPFDPMPPNENICRDMAMKSGVKLWTSPPIIAVFQGFSKVIRDASEAKRLNATDRCKYVGPFNYMNLASFFAAYNLDQAARMTVIAELSKATSEKTDDFTDIDGESVKAGIEKTLLNNLTVPNRNSAKMEMYNSLGAENCNMQGVASDQPAKWLSPVRINLAASYIDTVCDGTAINSAGADLFTTLPKYKDTSGLGSKIDELSRYLQFDKTNINSLHHFSLGVEKNPWCMAYVGVSATTAPKIPFSPFGAITLKAKAFYKPFGGRIGPWYYKMWHPSSPHSEGSLQDKTDANLPPRITKASELQTTSENAAENALRGTNYGRFVGDKLGLKTNRMLAFTTKAIHNMKSPRPNFDYWLSLPDGHDGDIMAFDEKASQAPAMRWLEMAAILPDTFDNTYYSIDPDYYHNYYLRLQNGYFKKKGQQKIASLRPDLGYRKNFKQGNFDFENFSIKNQFEFVNSTADSTKVKDIIKDEYTFILSDWKHLLTSWAPVNLKDYSLDTNKFGKCTSEPIDSDKNKPNPPTPGNCVVGGTTGYAVKMVSSEYLNAKDLKLGGEFSGSGPLLNPPPPDTQF